VPISNDILFLSAVHADRPIYDLPKIVCPVTKHSTNPLTLLKSQPPHARAREQTPDQAMGNAVQTPLPCAEFMDSYVKCMEEHEGVRPDPYEPEWCDEEKNSYLNCMAELRKHK
jgi:hypothetical protein